MNNKRQKAATRNTKKKRKPVNMLFRKKQKVSKGIYKNRTVKHNRKSKKSKKRMIQKGGVFGLPDELVESTLKDDTLSELLNHYSSLNDDVNAFIISKMIEKKKEEQSMTTPETYFPDPVWEDIFSYFHSSYKKPSHFVAWEEAKRIKKEEEIESQKHDRIQDYMRDLSFPEQMVFREDPNVLNYFNDPTIPVDIDLDALWNRDD